ncbi:hypothetical protein CEUSTIGMA_g2638.t1 [Chlamydomonas eustigma]|uniref:Uncharacterized protein n=1 Tax=Chlamydomonas eustigma TaxID=1157962 RepID=A0A250WWI3_9CHLO|nr:hypothetical protein CEUSTIGMA_g2638.t1 [Chlamydomonas eustigma]|eukprot:GAX75194.1 hypothetical protein CEUSTIGMA_g2638.t1 [Chlamydomonas eustigma]
MLDSLPECNNLHIARFDVQLTDEQRGDGKDTHVSFQRGFETSESSMPVWCWADFLKNAGPGLIMMTAFIDPGDLSNDLAVGSKYQFELLWIFLWSTIVGYILQMVVAKLAIVTRKSLAEKCHEEYPWFVNVFLWLLMEAALVAVEIQYITGASVGLSLLCGNNGTNLPLWASVLVCSTIAYLLLILEAYGVRLVEVLFMLLISVMCISFAILAGVAKAPGIQVLRGLAEPQLPNEQAAYLLAGGIVGGCISPYNFFLYSSLVISRPLPSRTRGDKYILLQYISLEAAIVLAFALFMNVCLVCTFAQTLYQPAGATSTYYNGSSTPPLLSPSNPGTLLVGVSPQQSPDATYTNYDYMENNPSLNNAGILLGQDWGQAFAYIWALGLLATGLSSTSGSVYAGQIIMEGFVKLKAWNRRHRGWLGSLIAIFHTSPPESVDLLDAPGDRSPSLEETMEGRPSTLSSRTKALVPSSCVPSSDAEKHIISQAHVSVSVAPAKTTESRLSDTVVSDKVVHQSALELKITAESAVPPRQKPHCDHPLGDDLSTNMRALTVPAGEGDQSISSSKASSYKRPFWLRFAANLGLMPQSSRAYSEEEAGRYLPQEALSAAPAAAPVAWKRATVSRTIALIPALIVAATYTNPQEILYLNLWLNLLQTLALPFSLLPMLHFTARSQVMGKYWKNHWFLTLLVAAITAFAVFIACYSTIQSTPFPTSSAAVGATWFGWALYLLAALYFAIGPDHIERFLRGGM